MNKSFAIVNKNNNETEIINSDTDNPYTKDNKQVDDFDYNRAIYIFDLFLQYYINIPFWDQNSILRNSYIPLVREGRLRKLAKIAHKYYPIVQLKYPSVELDIYLCAFIFFYVSITHLDTFASNKINSTFPAKIYYYIDKGVFPRQNKPNTHLTKIIKKINIIILELSNSDIVTKLEIINGGRKTKTKKIIKTIKIKKTIKKSRNKKNKKTIKKKP
jgi:hypothetical protein